MIAAVVRDLAERHRFDECEVAAGLGAMIEHRSEEHTSELQSLMRISYAVFCLKKKHDQEHNSETEQNSQCQNKSEAHLHQIQHSHSRHEKKHEHPPLMRHGS